MNVEPKELINAIREEIGAEHIDYANRRIDEHDMKPMRDYYEGYLAASRAIENAISRLVWTSIATQQKARGE